MRLRIERPTREVSDHQQAVEQAALDAAVRALREAQENVIGLVLLPPPQTAEALRHRAQEVARAAFKADDLTGGRPAGALHHEHSGWGLPIDEAPAVPTALLAADVLDFLASMLGPGDRLVTIEERAWIERTP